MPYSSFVVDGLLVVHDTVALVAPRTSLFKLIMVGGFVGAMVIDRLQVAPPAVAFKTYFCTLV